MLAKLFLEVVGFVYAKGKQNIVVTKRRSQSTRLFDLIEEDIENNFKNIVSEICGGYTPAPL